MKEESKKDEEKLKIVAIVGPTASGKSDLAVMLAKEFSGEVISADSRQVYAGLNIGTGKITQEEMRGIPHHLLDVADPTADHMFTVADYKPLAERAIREISTRGNLPILCGGTGLYIDAVLENAAFPDVPPNPEFRETLSEKTAEELFEMLEKADPRRAASIDRHNPARLIRALEIVEELGYVPDTATENMVADETPYDTLKIGITTDDAELKARITKRLENRLAHGMLEEAEQLHKNGLSFERMEMLGLEYRYQAQFLQGKITREKMCEEIIMQSWHYAKRQRTWFKRDKNTQWFSREDIAGIKTAVQTFLNN